MEENLIGYLLNSLDDATQQEVEGYLRSHPEAQEQLARLRGALEPLEADRDGPSPPAGLGVRTLARVAEHGWRELSQLPGSVTRNSRDGFPAPATAARELPKAPVLPMHRAPAPPRRWWRRADVLIAAGLLLGVLGLLPPAL